MAEAVGLDDRSPEGFLRWLADLKAEIELPRSLVDTAVDPDQLERLVDVAVEDTCHLNNPRPVARADFERIFVEAFQ